MPWSTDSSRASLQVVRTADAALARETGAGGGSESWLGQFVRQAWPLTLREQGPLVREGMDAVTITARGELPRGDGPDTLDGHLRGPADAASAARRSRAALAFDSPALSGQAARRAT